MKPFSLLPLVLFTACTIHIGSGQHEPPTTERVQQLIANLPDHGMNNSSSDEFTPEYYDLLTQAWALPSDAVDGIGSEEWLLYFVSGNGEGAIKTIVNDINYSNDSVIARFDMLFHVGLDQIDTLSHELLLTHSGEKWVINDFDGTKEQLRDYIRDQRELFRSPEWKQYLESCDQWEGGAQSAKLRAQEVEHYFRQYPD